MCTIEYQENEIKEPDEIFQESQPVSRTPTESVLDLVDHDKRNFCFCRKFCFFFLNFLVKANVKF